MNFDFTDEQKQFAEQVSRFAREHLAKGALKRAHDPRFPFDAAEIIAKQGLMGITLPQNEGGQGGKLMDAVIAIMEVAAACPRSADVVQFGNFGPIRTFAEYGTPAQKARWLGDLLAGRMVMSLGMTEPDAGSALTDLKTGARADGGHYVIDGTKVFSTFSPDARIFLIYVRFGPGVGGIGSVLVERGRSLCEFQGLQWKFADMAIKLESAQLLLYRAAANADRGLPSAYETAIAKTACNQAGFDASEAVQIMGALGYSSETLVEYCMRRARGFMLAGGSIEILKNRIAEYVFDRRFDQRGRSSATAE
jgi:alkylation response protein AidB-like acyl-CoA dehydrogenase